MLERVKDVERLVHGHYIEERFVSSLGMTTGWCGRYQLPMRMPVAKTIAPPRATCREAENAGVSI